MRGVDAPQGRKENGFVVIDGKKVGAPGFQASWAEGEESPKEAPER
jgi:hypothetical protein